MGLSVTVGGVAVAACRPRGVYGFDVKDMMRAAGIRDEGCMGMHKEHMFMRDGMCFADIEGFRECVSLMQARAGAASEGPGNEMRTYADRLSSCVDCCEQWIRSRRLPRWQPAGPKSADEGRGVRINGVLVYATRDGSGTYFFQPSGMLRAAGLSAEGAAGSMAAYKSSGHMIKATVSAAAKQQVWFLDLDGYKEYINRKREETKGRGFNPWVRGWRDKRDQVEEDIARLEECVAECESWIEYLEGSQADGVSDPQTDDGSDTYDPECQEHMDGMRMETEEAQDDALTEGDDDVFSDGALFERLDRVPEDDVAEEGVEQSMGDGQEAAIDGDTDGKDDALMENDDECFLEYLLYEEPHRAQEADGAEEAVGLSAGDGPEAAGDGGVDGQAGGTEPVDSGEDIWWPSMVPEGAIAQGMVATLLDRLPLLCEVFGIGGDISRDGQLAWLVWMLLYREAFMDSPDRLVWMKDRNGKPEGKLAAMAFLWRGASSARIRDLVEAAMME